MDRAVLSSSSISSTSMMLDGLVTIDGPGPAISDRRLGRCRSLRTSAKRKRIDRKEKMRVCKHGGP